MIVRHGWVIEDWSVFLMDRKVYLTGRNVAAAVGVRENHKTRGRVQEAGSRTENVEYKLPCNSHPAIAYDRNALHPHRHDSASLDFLH